MISGLGFFEIVIILLIVLMFFGSKELPRFIRETARMISKLRLYSEKVRRELNDITDLSSVTTVENNSFHDEVRVNKNRLRALCFRKRKALTPPEHAEKSARIVSLLFETEEFKNARVVMIYAATATEVQTEECVRAMLAMGKRVVMPYCYHDSIEMGIAEIQDYSADLRIGEYRLREPIDALRGNFLKSDIGLVVCPVVGFDIKGARLGRGKGCYDAFLKELKEKTTIAGFAYHCQMLDEELPFDYHDIPMDMMITEQGVVRYGTEAG